jgi:hypothetical protein
MNYATGHNSFMSQYLLLSLHELYRGRQSLQFFYCNVYTLPQKHVYLSVLLFPHEPYRGQHFLQFFYSTCAYTVSQRHIYYCNARMYTLPWERVESYVTTNGQSLLEQSTHLGSYDNTSCAYTLQRDRVYLSVTTSCNAFTFPFSILILGTKVP